mgnify:CR=1 FL=1
MAYDTMKTVIIGVETRAEAKARIGAALNGKPQGSFISFISVDLMWKILTPKRWEIIRAMTSGTWLRPSLRPPGQARKPSPARTCLLSLCSWAQPRWRNHCAACWGLCKAGIKTTRPLLWP